MGQIQDFRLPDLGEGLTEGEILGWLVSPGDTITLNQPIVEVETAKASVEIPSPYAGVVTTLHHDAGASVAVGSVIISIDTQPAEPGTSTPTGDISNPDSPADITSSDSERTPMLVGYGPRAATVARRRRVSSATASARATVSTQPRLDAPVVATSPAVLAKPPVRQLARQLGVDLTTVTGTGHHGTITRADVTAAKSAGSAALASATSTTDSDERRERRIPVAGVRKHTAAAMVASALTAPHVTEFITVDMTAAMQLRDRLVTQPEFAHIKITPLLLVAQALLLALRRHPDINSSWDEAAQEIVVKDYVHLGIAVASPRGLLVPNIKDADRLSLAELAAALRHLTQAARGGTTALADMRNGTITITNVGTFGVDNGTPILNPGESAILCLGAIRPTPWVVDDQIAIRQVTQLSMSFDHRIIDGQGASEFLADLAHLLTNPEIIAWHAR